MIIGYLTLSFGLAGIYRAMLSFRFFFKQQIENLKPVLKLSSVLTVKKEQNETQNKVEYNATVPQKTPHKTPRNNKSFTYMQFFRAHTENLFICEVDKYAVRPRGELCIVSAERGAGSNPKFLPTRRFWGSSRPAPPTGPLRHPGALPLPAAAPPAGRRGE